MQEIILNNTPRFIEAGRVICKRNYTAIVAMYSTFCVCPARIRLWDICIQTQPLFGKLAEKYPERYKK